MRRLTVVLLAGIALLALAGGAWGASEINGRRVIAFCPSGYDDISGGFESAGADSEVFFSSDLGVPDGWAAGIDNSDSTVDADLTAFSYCVPAGRAVVAAQRSRAHIVRSCSAGYVRARIGGETKCLHAGEFCARRYQRKYRSHGFRCGRGSDGRLRLRRR